MTRNPRLCAFPPLPPAFFAQPAEVVAPELIGCRLVRRQADGALLWGASLPGKPERIAAGPGLLARRFGLDRPTGATRPGQTVQACRCVLKRAW